MYHNMSYVSYHVSYVILCHIMPYHVILYIISCHIIYHMSYISYHVLSYNVILCHIMSYHVIYIMSYHISCHIIYHVISYIISYHMSYIMSYVMSYRSISSKCLKLPTRRVSAISRKTWIFISATVANSNIKISVLERAMQTFDSWRWNHYAVSKRRTQITKRHDATSQEKECLKCTVSKAENSLFNLFAGITWPRVKSRCHGRSDRRDQFRSSRCWHVCRTCVPQPSERWCCDVTVVW
jgi:hypothetical protein